MALHQGVRRAKAAMRYQLDRFDGNDMLPLLLYEMAAATAQPVVPPVGVRSISNDVATDRDYDKGLRNVRSQRKAHWVETHAAIALPGDEEWDCASFDGYMCECRKREAPGKRNRAHRCRHSIAAACFDAG